MGARHRFFGRKRETRNGSAGARIGTVALIAVVLAVAMLPLFPAGARAANDDQLDVSAQAIVGGPQVDVDDLDLTLATPDDPGDEPPVAVTPDDPAPTGTIQVTKLGCPEDYGGDYDQLAANCTAMSAPFSVDDGSGAVGFDGSFTAEDLAAGAVTVAEQVPDGYADPVVFCDSYDASGNESGFLPAPLEGATLTYELAAGEYLACEWFNIPTEGGTITVHKWVCPENLAFVAAPTEDDLLLACAEAQDGVSFDLSYPSDASLSGQTRTTGDDGAGTAVFDDVEAAGVRVQETIPAGYGDPMVFCGWGAIYEPQPGGGPVAVDGQIPLATLPGGTLDTEFLPNEQMVCEWFNIPSGVDIVVHKWSCPSDWDAYGASFDELAATCTDVVSGVDFTLTDASDSLVGVENTDDTGTAVFRDVDGGAYDLTEAIPSGYGTPIVFCFFNEEEGSRQDVGDGDSIRLDFPGNDKVVCEWFNVPTTDGSITVYKYTCPAGYDLSLPGDPKADCLDLTDGITFELSGGSIGSSPSTTGDALPGGVSWGGLEAGTYTAKEQVPDGIVGTYVTCLWYDGDGIAASDGYQPYASYGGAGIGDAVDLVLPAGERIVCLWFNAPAYHGGHLVVTKYWCDGYLYDAAHCDLYGGGADFEVARADGWGSATPFTTGSDGTITVDLDAGEYALREIGREWCRAESDSVNADGYVVVADGEYAEVNVYNCGKRPTTGGDTPKKFPNTGVGVYAAGTDGAQPGTTIAFAAASVILLAGAGLWRRRARPVPQPVRVRA